MAGPEMSDASQPLTQYAIRDPEQFAANLGRAAEAGARALSAYLKARNEGVLAEQIAGPVAEVTRTIGKVAEYWSSDPARMIEAQGRLFTLYFNIWTSALQMSGPAAAFSPGSADKRFSDPDWNSNPLFSSLMQIYLATTRWAEDMVERAEGLDEPTRNKARFYIQQIGNALSPTNFLLTNPSVLKETAATSGENLVKGMQMLAEDIERGKGELRIRQTSSEKFKLGETLATTPGKVIFQNDIFQLIQYAASTEKVFKRPLLIVPPWINKFYILDLTPEKSLIRWLVDKGHTVFVISWVNPESKHATKDFESYMREGVLAALDVIEKATGEDTVNALGYCVGGTLLAVTLGYLAAKGEERIATATLLTAQVDFASAGDLKLFADRAAIEGVESAVAKAGFLEASKMASAFNLMRSNDLIWPYVINNYMLGKEPLPFDLLHWNSDATRMPGANHLFYLRNCYLENKLAKGEMEVGGTKIDLSKVTVPIYNLATKEDHIAPAKSVFVGSSSFGGPVRFVLSGSGHIAGVVNPPERKKYQFWIGGKPEGTLDDWMAKATEHPGSWWDDWQAWLEGFDDRRVRKRRPGGGKIKPIEDAPGSYVRVQS